MAQCEQIDVKFIFINAIAWVIRFLCSKTPRYKLPQEPNYPCNRNTLRVHCRTCNVGSNAFQKNRSQSTIININQSVSIVYNYNPSLSTSPTPIAKLKSGLQKCKSQLFTSGCLIFWGPGEAVHRADLSWHLRFALSLRFRSISSFSAWRLRAFKEFSYPFRNCTKKAANPLLCFSQSHFNGSKQLNHQLSSVKECHRLRRILKLLQRTSGGTRLAFQKVQLNITKDISTKPLAIAMPYHC